MREKIITKLKFILFWHNYNNNTNIINISTTKRWVKRRSTHLHLNTYSSKVRSTWRWRPGRPMRTSKSMGTGRPMRRTWRPMRHVRRSRRPMMAMRRPRRSMRAGRCMKARRPIGPARRSGRPGKMVMHGWWWWTMKWIWWGMMMRWWMRSKRIGWRRWVVDRRWRWPWRSSEWIWWPRGSRRRMVVVVIHGFGWKGKESDLVKLRYEEEFWLRNR